jgi:uncharacterized protein Yka (UPF0111/DUF47 family)
MSSAKQPPSDTRPLEAIFKTHIENSVTCSHALNELFANLAEPLAFIAKIKQLEDAGDELTADDIDHAAIVL